MNRLILLCLLSATVGSAAPAPVSPVQLANPLQGTDSTPWFSHGNTYPAIALPFPVHTWAPYTEPQNNSFYYQYHHQQIRGIRQTHQPSAWIPEYGAFSLMPVSGKLVVTEDDRVSDFSHDHETAQPSYYQVHLNRWNANAEVTPTERAARFRFTFEKAENAFVILDLFRSEKLSSVQIIPSERKVIGIVKNNRGAVPDNFGNYFVIIFDQPFQASGVWSNETILAGETNLSGTRIGAFLQFNAHAGQQINCRVASSYISHEQAMRTMQQEIGDADFDTIRSRAETRWNEILNRARITGGTEEQQRTFYSAMYRSVMFPHRFYEHDENMQPIYFSPYDGKIHKGFMYTDTGYWDTFRAAHPLYNLLFPEISAEIVQAILNAHREDGWLPQWSSPGFRNAMIGNHAFSVLADAWVKGVRSFDLNEAVDAIVHDAHNKAIFGRGREGSEAFDKIGYIPFKEIPDSTSKTLEYSYDDACAAVLARAAHRDADANAFLKTAMNYTNVFDATTGFMRGRNRDGSWATPFDPTEWGGAFVEGNAWQWTWSVMQDVPGLINLYGGDDGFVRKLDGLFNAGSDVNVGSYHTMIHEMNEMVAQGLGQYAHCNEPNHHVTYLYDYAGQPWKTQFKARLVMNQLYQSTPDGLSGDDDNGQTSAWYVFSALGFYPVCPGTDVYAIGSPLFDRAVLTVGDHHQFTIVAKENGPQRPYIHAATLDGKPLNRAFLTHGQIVHGNEVDFEMTSGPDYKWATDKDARQPSLLPTLLAQ